MVEVVVYLSMTGLGLLALPQQVVAAVATPTASPVQTVAGILGAVDGGATSQGWTMRGMLAAPMTVNLGALNLTWLQQISGEKTSNLLGVKLGVMNTTAPMTCDGKNHVILQLDSRAGSYSARLSAVGGQTDTTAARIEYRCTQ